MKAFKISLLTVVSLMVFSLFLLCWGYISWEREILGSDSDVICLNNLSKEDLEISNKVEKFVMSKNRVETISFSPGEVANIIKENIQLGEGMEIQEICILPSDSIWEIYLKGNMNKIALLWVVFDLVKDERETAELYVRKFMIGKYNLPFGLEQRVVTNINKGVSEALILINENRFLSREIKNIELLQEKIVIKGLSY